MTENESLIEAIRKLDPAFTFEPKSSRWFTRLHERVFPGAVVILGHTCYYPEQEADKDRDNYMCQLMAHEGMHIAQKLDFGVFQWNWLYAYPQGFGGVLALVGVLVGVIFGAFAGLIWGILAASGGMLSEIFLLVNRTMADMRKIFEIEAYATFLIVENLEPRLSEQDSKIFQEFLSYLEKALNSRSYLWCGRGSKRAETAYGLHRTRDRQFLKDLEWPCRAHSRQWISTLQRIFS